MTEIGPVDGGVATRICPRPGTCICLLKANRKEAKGHRGRRLEAVWLKRVP